MCLHLFRNTSFCLYLDVVIEFNMSRKRNFDDLKKVGRNPVRIIHFSQSPHEDVSYSDEAFYL